MSPIIIIIQTFCYNLRKKTSYNYRNLSVSYSRQLRSALASQESFCERRQVVSMTAPKRMGPGINARIRTISCWIPRPNEPMLSGIHLGEEMVIISQEK